MLLLLSMMIHPTLLVVPVKWGILWRKIHPPTQTRLDVASRGEGEREKKREGDSKYLNWLREVLFFPQIFQSFPSPFSYLHFPVLNQNTDGSSSRKRETWSERERGQNFLLGFVYSLFLPPPPPPISEQCCQAPMFCGHLGYK